MFTIISLYTVSFSFVYVIIITFIYVLCFTINHKPFVNVVMCYVLYFLHMFYGIHAMMMHAHCCFPFFEIFFLSYQATSLSPNIGDNPLQTQDESSFPNIECIPLSTHRLFTSLQTHATSLSPDTGYIPLSTYRLLRSLHTQTTSLSPHTGYFALSTHRLHPSL